MKTKSELAADLFRSGFNCSQSVLGVFCETYGLSQETALKIGCPLGSGVRSGDVCGAVSGGVLVIGLKYGHCIPGDLEAKARCHAKTEEFLVRFRRDNASIVCRDILGCDISTPSGLAEAQRENLFKTVCVDTVISAVKILEDLGY